MAYEVNPLGITAVASADLSANQYYFGYINANGEVAVQTAAGAAADGVIAEKPKAEGRGFAFNTVPGAIVKVAAGAAFSLGDLLDVDSTGRAVTHTTGKIVARALAAATAAGDVVPALLILQR